MNNILINKPIWIFQSPATTRSGYGDWGMEVAKSLLRYATKKNIDIRYVMTPWGQCSPRNLTTALETDAETKEIISRVLTSPLNKQPEVFLQMTIPSEYQQPAKFNIGLTAGIESSVPNPSWIEKMNAMSLNIVMSEFNQKVFTSAKFNKKNPNGTTEELKLNKPVEILHWGYNREIGKSSEKIDSIETTLGKIKENFAFLFVGQWTNGNMNADRKAIGFLIKTFLETFKDVDSAPCLILKTSGAQISMIDKEDCLNKMKQIINMVQEQHPSSKLPMIYLLHGELETQEMNALYNHEKVKVHVNFTHGEGFGMPLLEATLSGKPCLFSGWSGHLDFMNPSYSDKLEGKLEPVPQEALNDWFIQGSQWFNVDYDAAGKKLMYYFKHYGENQMLENAEKLRVENSVKFSVEEMDKQFHAILDKYVPAFEAQKIMLPKLKKINLPTLVNPSNNK